MEPEGPKHRGVCSCESVVYLSPDTWMLTIHELLKWCTLGIKKKSFIYLAELGLSCSMWTVRCGMWDLVPWPGNGPRTLALGATVLPIGPPQKSHFRDSLNGGFTMWTSLIINSIFRSSPFARRQGVGLKGPSIESWPPLFSDQVPHRSPHRRPPRVTTLEQQVLQNPEKFQRI